MYERRAFRARTFMIGQYFRMEFLIDRWKMLGRQSPIFSGVLSIYWTGTNTANKRLNNYGLPTEVSEQYTRAQHGKSYRWRCIAISIFLCNRSSHHKLEHTYYYTSGYYCYTFSYLEC